METPDAIVVLAGGIKQDAFGRWVSTDLTAADDAFGAPGAKLRVIAAAKLAIKYPNAAVVASGGKGFDVPKDAPENRPLLAEILRDELIECGVPAAHIVLETSSNSTYQQLQELERFITKQDWHAITIVTNRYHLPRVQTVVDVKFSKLVGVIELVSAEDILIEADPARWEDAIEEAYGSTLMAERVEREKKGVVQIKDGTYQFR